MKKINLQENEQMLDALWGSGRGNHYAYNADQHVYKTIDRNLVSDIYKKASLDLIDSAYIPFRNGFFQLNKKDAN